MFLWDGAMSMPWEVPEKRFDRIEAASIDASGWLRVRIAYEQGTADTWAARVPIPDANESWFAGGARGEARVTSRRSLPQSIVDVHIVDVDRVGERLHTGDGAPRGVCIGLQRGDYRALILADARGSRRCLSVSLPAPGIAWDTPGTAALLGVTPFSLAFDVAASPVYLVLGVVWAAGGMPGH